MLYKEIRDTIKLFIASIVFALITLGFSYLMIRLLVDKTFVFADTAPIWSYIILMGMAFYLGISLFSEEKNERTFEYLFSLKYSRNEILFRKMVPRLAALTSYLLLYIILSQIRKPFPVPGGWLITILLYLSLFLSATSISLLHKHHLVNTLYALAIFLVVYGVFFLIILQSRFLPIEVSSLIQIMMMVIFLISMLIFIAFWYHFARVDLGNFTGLFGRSVFSLLKIAGTPVLILLIIWVVINRLDAPEIQTGFAPEENQTRTAIDKNNGCYRLWTLSEAPEVDVDSDEIRVKYQQLIDSEMFKRQSSKAWNQHDYTENYRLLNQKRHHILKKKVNDLEILTRPDKDLVQEIHRAREPILRLSRQYHILLSRYRKLLDCQKFEDLTSPQFDSPLPNLVAWLHVSKLYDWIAVVEALEGNWDQASGRLFDHIDFQKKVLRDTRILLVNLTCKSNLQYTLYTVASLMNRKECPGSVFQMVLSRLPACSIEEVGTRKALETDYLGWADFIDKKQYLEGDNFILKWISALFLQKNRTKNYFYKPYKEMIDLESQSPYQWETGLETIRGKCLDNRKKNFWWVQNPLGKSLAGTMVIANLPGVIHKTILLKSLADMIRISAELHLRYDPGKPVEANLSELSAYRIQDPCSGKPYRWNGEKKVLYSLGVDRDDDQGRFNFTSFLDTDYILRVVLPGKQ